MRAILIPAEQLAALSPLDLLGAVLLSSTHAGGRRVAKGTRLDATIATEFVAAAQRAELTDVRLAFLDPDDVHEDEAAERLGSPWAAVASTWTSSARASWT